MTTEDYSVGSIVEGDVTNITKFGLFVKLANGKEGLVHISEIADEFVTDINQYAKVGDHIQVRITSINSEKKLDLSIKKVKEKEQVKEKEPGPIFIKKSKSEDFEKKLGSFLKRAEEKQIDIRRNLKFKQGLVKKKHK